MLKRRVLFCSIFILLMALSSNVYAANVLMQIGRSPFHKPPLTSQADLIAMVQSKKAEVEKGFKLAGNGELYAPFAEQIGSAEIAKVEYGKGTHFEWMFYKRKGVGTVKVMKDVTWGNQTPFTGFQLDIEYNGSIYTFVVPLGCGNVALMGSTVKPVAAAAPPPPPRNQDPQCSMSVSPAQAFCGEMVTIDASSSTDADGKITQMKVAFVDAKGQVVSEKVVDGTVTTVAMPCGNTNMQVTVTDNDGAQATSPQCAAGMVGMKRVKFLADAGYIRQFDPAHYLFGRVGLEYKFTEQWGVLGLIGGAGHLEGIDGKSAFLADLLGEYSFSRYFADFGIGGWITDGDDDNPAEDSKLDLIAGFGARVFGEPEGFNGSLFFEVRTAPDEIDELIDYGRFGIGMRFRF
jgi:hypothetical protein